MPYDVVMALWVITLGVAIGAIAECLRRGYKLKVARNNVDLELARGDTDRIRLNTTTTHLNTALARLDNAQRLDRDHMRDVECALVKFRDAVKDVVEWPGNDDQ